VTKAPLSIVDIVHDPFWLADRYDPEHDAFHFRYVNRNQHRAATFLTAEYLGEAPEPLVIRRADAMAAKPPQAPLHFIFHSAFCCSTLLARAMDLPGLAMGLKEPLIFNDIVGWRQRGGDPQKVAQVLDDALSLLGRPFMPGEAVIIKPSNLLNALAPTIMQLRPKAKALVLNAPLPIFLTSVAKKGITGRLWVRDLLIKQLRDNFIDLGFENEDYLGLTDIQTAAVGWLAQQALFEKMIGKFECSRVRCLDSETFLENPRLSIAALALFFDIELSDATLDRILSGSAFRNNSKTGELYSLSERKTGYDNAAQAHSDEISKVAIWTEAVASNVDVLIEKKSTLINYHDQISIQIKSDSRSINASMELKHTANLRSMALKAMQSGQITLATSYYRTLVELDPDHADDWFNLAYLQRCARRYHEAIHSYRMSLDYGIDRPEEVHLNVSVILSEFLNDTDSAKKEIEEAIRLNPNFVPALMNLASLFEDMGQPEDAQIAYNKILRIEPSNGRALGRNAIIDVFAGETIQTIERLKTAFSTSMHDADKSEISFALGHALDAEGSYGEAFEAFTVANQSRMKSAKGSACYHPDESEQLVSSLIQIFDQPVNVSVSSDISAPIFICGMFRSGSTLVEQILARHSRITAGGEIETIPALVAEQLMPYPMSLKNADNLIFDQLREVYFEELGRLHSSFDIITDKRPDNFLHIGLIKSIFPNAKFVHTKRQPLDNILSIYFGNFDDSINYSHRLTDIAHWYRQYHRIMDHWLTLYPDDIFNLDYDNLVKQPNSGIFDVLSFLNIANESACYLDDRKDNKIVRTLSNWQVRQPLHQRSSGRWHNYAPYLGNLNLD
jgi:tetratricopeptide (TPR) repeat protein